MADLVNLSGKTALVAGASTDLIAHTLSEAGASVTTFVEATPEATLATIQQIETVHIAVLCPDWRHEAVFMDTAPDLWRTAILHNFESILLSMQTIARHMIAQQVKGRIIVVSSVAALRPLRNLSTLGTTLAALHVVARMAAVDLGPYGITVNVVASGWMTDGWRSASFADANLATLEANIPVDALGSMRDVGELCCFLGSEQAAYLTGAIIPVDGGYLLTKAGAGTPRTPTG